MIEKPDKNSMVLRMRRLRRLDATRRLVRETRASSSDLIYPMFVDAAISARQAIPSMPGIYRLPLTELEQEVTEISSLRIPAVLLFGLPEKKDSRGTEAYATDGIVQQAIRLVKKANPQLAVISDVCLCQYTDHGHCGIVKDGVIDNDETIELLSKIAISHARAGADIVGPSAMMDGQVRAIRNGLDANGLNETAIMSYSAKFASSFYGPFREAANSTPLWGDRRTYQMDPSNTNEALREIALDIDEGADIVMVKPALAYLDILSQARSRFSAPIAAFNVSGEFAMIKAAAEKGWLNEKTVAMEVVTSMKRAGADMIISYFAKTIARQLQEASE